MCIAIYKPERHTLSEESLRNCWLANPDGSGFAWGTGKKLHIRKALTWTEFLRQWHACEHETTTYDTVVHFRIGTSGAMDLRNCHPHVVRKNELCMVHNGILPLDVPVGSPISDTAIFAGVLKDDMPRHWYRDSAWQDELGDMIGEGNKIVIIDKRCNAAIINEHRGHWHDGIWYSNHSYETPRYSYLDRDYLWWDKREQEHDGCYWIEYGECEECGLELDAAEAENGVCWKCFQQIEKEWMI